MTCNRVAIIHQGQVITTGAIDELMAQLTGDPGYELEVEGSFEEIQQRLQCLPGIQKVERVNSNHLPPNHLRIRVLTKPGLELGRELTATLAEAGLGLYEMRSAKASLEDIFLKLTTEEGVPDPVSADTAKVNSGKPSEDEVGQ